MKQTRVASRYAKAVLDLALEQHVLEQVKADMHLVSETFKSNRELSAILASPLVKSDKKVAILNAVFGGQIGTLSTKFLDLITSSKRGDVIEAVADEFLNTYKKHKNILTAVVTTAVGLDDVLKEKVLNLVRNGGNQEIELIQKIDPKLVGGFILDVEDKRIDASIQNKFDKLRRAFNTSTSIN